MWWVLDVGDTILAENKYFYLMVQVLLSKSLKTKVEINLELKESAKMRVFM